MLRYFRINDPYRLLGLLIILILIYIPVFIDSPGITLPELKSLVLGEKVHEGNVPYASIVDSTPPLAAYFFGLADVFFGKSIVARHLLGFLILFSQSIYLGFLFLDKKAFSENTFIPSLLFSVLAFFSFDVLSLSGELLGSGFLLLALNSLFKEIEFRTQRDETIFNLGLYISLASLCSFSFIVHLLAAFTILLMYARTSPRGFMLLILGFLLPHLLMMSLYFLNGKLYELWQFYYLPNLSFISEKFINTSSLLVLGAFPALYLVISVVILNRDARFTKYQSQLLQSMFFWMLFSFFQVLYSKDLRPQSFIILIPSLSFFITHFLLLIRRRKFAEINIWILFTGIVSISFLARYQKIEKISYKSLLVMPTQSMPVIDKRILVLGDEFSKYHNNTLATPFLNWGLSNEFFEHPEFYDNLILVNNALTDDPPDIIYDKNNLMKPYFERIPQLKNSYRKTSVGTYQKIKKEL